jgi:hypothetical protein
MVSRTVVVIEAVEVLGWADECRAHHKVVMDGVLVRHHPFRCSSHSVGEPNPRFTVPAAQTWIPSNTDRDSQQ